MFSEKGEKALKKLFSKEKLIAPAGVILGLLIGFLYNRGTFFSLSSLPTGSFWFLSLFFIGLLLIVIAQADKLRYRSWFKKYGTQVRPDKPFIPAIFWRRENGEWVKKRRSIEVERLKSKQRNEAAHSRVSTSSNPEGWNNRTAGQTGYIKPGPRGVKTETFTAEAGNKSYSVKVDKEGKSVSFSGPGGQRTFSYNSSGSGTYTDQQK